jgi:hypothetical protein
MTALRSSRLLAFLAVIVALVAGLPRRGRSGAAQAELFWPLALGYGLVAVAAAVLVIAPTLFDKKVDEQIVTGAPAGAAGDPASRERRGNVEVASGRFASIAHQGSGRAAVVQLPGGARKLTLSDFETDSGPDLRVYGATGDPARDDLGEFRDLGALKGNVGSQQYDLSPGVNLRRYSTVVIWCRAFSVAFASAPLRST